MQPLQAPGRADRRDRVPLDQAAAYRLVPGDLPPDPEQGRDDVRSSWRGGWATRQPTAWLIEAEADGGDGASASADKPKLAGRVEVDDAYLGGERSGGKRGPRRRWQDAVRCRGRDRGRAQAQPAAAHRRQGLPQEGGRGAGQARLRRRQQRRQRSACPAGGGREQAGCTTSRCSPARGRRPPSGAPLQWVNTGPCGNIKTALAGTYHHVSAEARPALPPSFA